MAIVRAALNDLEQCTDILFTQELGMHYYPRRELLKKELEKGCESGELFVKKLTMGGG